MNSDHIFQALENSDFVYDSGNEYQLPTTSDEFSSSSDTDVELDYYMNTGLSTPTSISQN